MKETYPMMVVGRSSFRVVLNVLKKHPVSKYFCSASTYDSIIWIPNFGVLFCCWMSDLTLLFLFWRLPFDEDWRDMELLHRIECCIPWYWMDFWDNWQHVMALNWDQRTPRSNVDKFDFLADMFPLLMFISPSSRRKSLSALRAVELFRLLSFHVTVITKQEKQKENIICMIPRDHPARKKKRILFAWFGNISVEQLHWNWRDPFRVI